MIWLQLPDIERKKVLNAVGGITQLSTAAIEKDWWVTVVLYACFRTPWARQLAFKGGTSLSKAWGLIERFRRHRSSTGPCCPGFSR
jgi:predicted nucleotidyltransferase component of viral defense system